MNATLELPRSAEEQAEAESYRAPPDEYTGIVNTAIAESGMSPAQRLSTSLEGRYARKIDNRAAVAPPTEAQQLENDQRELFKQLVRVESDLRGDPDNEDYRKLQSDLGAELNEVTARQSELSAGSRFPTTQTETPVRTRVMAPEPSATTSSAETRSVDETVRTAAPVLRPSRATSVEHTRETAPALSKPRAPVTKIDGPRSPQTPGETTVRQPLGRRSEGVGERPGFTQEDVINYWKKLIPESTSGGAALRERQEQANRSERERGEKPSAPNISVEIRPDGSVKVDASADVDPAVLKARLELVRSTWGSATSAEPKSGAGTATTGAELPVATRVIAAEPSAPATVIMPAAGAKTEAAAMAPAETAAAKVESPKQKIEGLIRKIAELKPKIVPELAKPREQTLLEKLTQRLRLRGKSPAEVEMDLNSINAEGKIREERFAAIRWNEQVAFLQKKLKPLLEAGLAEYKTFLGRTLDFERKAQDVADRAEGLKGMEAALEAERTHNVDVASLLAELKGASAADVQRQEKYRQEKEQFEDLRAELAASFDAAIVGTELKTGYELAQESVVTFRQLLQEINRPATA